MKSRISSFTETIGFISPQSCCAFEVICGVFTDSAAFDADEDCEQAAAPSANHATKPHTTRCRPTIRPPGTVWQCTPAARRLTTTRFPGAHDRERRFRFDRGDEGGAAASDR